MVTDKGSAVTDLKQRFNEIEQLALAAGLRPYDVHFFEVPVSLMYEISSYGLPTRYSHWSFGKIYQYQKTQGEMGFSKVYELILNNDPSYAFLDRSNIDTTNLLIAAHCFGHSDFFRNNVMFDRANETNMIHVAKRHAESIDNYRKDYGDDEVDEWLDVALALENHIDVHRGLKRKRYPQRHIDFEERVATKWEDVAERTPKPLVKKVVKGIHIPPHPEKDILWFLAQYSNIEPWQRHVFEIVRRESYYFYPQFRTKVMNEGWACMPGSTFVLTNRGYIRYKDLVEDFSSFQVATGQWSATESHLIDISRNVPSFPCLKTPSDRYITPPKPTIRILTDKGITFEGAKNHRTLGYRASAETEGIRDIHLRDFSVGDFVVMDIGTDTWAKNKVKCEFEHPRYSRSKPFTLPQVVDVDLAKFLGYFLSEGCTVKRGVQITNKDQSLIADFCKVSNRVFNLEPVVSPRQEDPDKYDCILWCSAVVRFLEHLNIDLSYLSKQKQVPDVIMRSPKKVVAAFLSAYFAGDGGCYDANKVILSTSSPLMSEQIGMLLLNFGIDYSHRELHKKGYDPNSHLVITGSQNVWLYSKFIGFASVEYKKTCCERILQKNKKHELKKGMISAKITNISEGFDILYDITVPVYHRYIAQGVVQHNSYWHSELMHQYALGNDNDYGVTGIDHPLNPEEIIDFLAVNEKVVQPGMKLRLKVDVEEVDHLGRPTGKTKKAWNPHVKQNPGLFHRATRVNPYYVGLRMFRDIKERWDKYYEEGYMEGEWGEKIPVTINGDQKIREVMEDNDDVSFFRDYLTEELADKLHLFAYGNNDKYKDDYDIQEEIQKRFRDNADEHFGELDVDDQIVENKTYLVRSKKIQDVISWLARARNNYGVPCVVIRRIDEAGMLRLEHLNDNAVNLDLTYAEHVLKYVGRAWGRPVELIRREKDRTWVLSYDGVSFAVDHQSPDYPDIVESNQIPSSW